MSIKKLIIVGGGLAGSEAAWQAGNRGIEVILYEMRPVKMTEVHVSSRLAELVCSNSLGSNLINRASGLLKQELRILGSLLIECADKTSVPAGRALAVDRNAFAEMVTEKLSKKENITIVREEVVAIPEETTVISTGPLTAKTFSRKIIDLVGEKYLYFYDAISPIVETHSINMDIVFKSSRYEYMSNKGGDYINCPFNEDQYKRFVQELIKSERIKIKSFESDIFAGVSAGPEKYFEGCLPIEVMADRDERSLLFGPMRPVGLIDPKSGRKPYAVVQLRKDNLAGSLHNLVGFQTNLKISEQDRIFRLIPGLESAVFVRYGQMHRNMYINSPKLLEPTLRFSSRNNLFFAGQITGVEGYAANIGTGLLAGLNAAKTIINEPLERLPETTMLGALCHYISNAEVKEFQPMKPNFGILPALSEGKLQNRQQRADDYKERALTDLKAHLPKNRS